jgi:hypothetical protein
MKGNESHLVLYAVYIAGKKAFKAIAAGVDRFGVPIDYNCWHLTKRYCCYQTILYIPHIK